MDNPDILSLILSRVDDNTLGKLAKISLWTSVKQVLLDPYFWYLRCQELVGRSLTIKLDVVWQRVYNILEALIQDRDPGEINNLAIVQVIIEAFGIDRWNKTGSWGPWMVVTDITALKYLLYNQYIEVDTDLIRQATRLAAMRDNRELLDFLLSLLGSDVIAAVNGAIAGAIWGDQLELFKYLWKLASTMQGGLPRISSESEMLREASMYGSSSIASYLLEPELQSTNLTRVIDAAIRYGTAEIVESLLKSKPEVRSLKLSYYDKSVIYAAKTGRVDVIKILVKYMKSKIPARDVLNTGIRSNKIEVVKYALTLVNPATKNNEALVLAMEGRVHDIINLLLQDSRVDPNSNIKKILAHVSGDGLPQRMIYNTISVHAPVLVPSKRITQEEAIDLIIQDQRVDLERMDKFTIRLVTSTLEDLIEVPIAGYIAGNNLAEGRVVTTSDVQTLINNKSDGLYSSLIKFLIVKRPSAREIFRWLGQSNSPELVLQAAKSVLNSKLPCPEEAVPLRELILALIYPSMTLRESYEILKKEGRDEVTIILSCRLVGTYIGYRDER